MNRNLIDVNDLATLIHEGEFQIVESSWQGHQNYLAGHIPGAIYLEMSLLDDPLTFNKLPDERLLQVLIAHGLTADTPVLLYGKDPLSAFRAASILLYAGVREVRILDGGYNSWLHSSRKVERKQNFPVSAESFGAQFPAQHSYFIDMEEVKALLAVPQSVLVCVRSWSEFVGDISGYAYIQPKGRIAGSVWGGSGSGTYQMEDYFNADSTLRPLPSINSMWEKAGILSSSKVAFYCGTGWRASVAFYLAYLMGWEDIAIYDGGWYEWSMDPINPIHIGIPDSLTQKG